MWTLHKLLCITNMTSHDLLLKCSLITSFRRLVKLILMQNPCDVLFCEICWIMVEVLDILPCMSLICKTSVVFCGKYYSHNLEAFPVAHWIAHTTCNVEGFCMKDNNVFASCEAPRNLDGQYDHNTNDPCTFGPPKCLVYMPQKIQSLIHTKTHAHNQANVTRGITMRDDSMVTTRIHCLVMHANQF